MTAHASFVDHRLGSEPNSNRQYMTENDNGISVESYIDSTHVNNKKFVPRAVESQTLLSAKGISIDNDHNEPKSAVNIIVDNEFVSRASESQTKLSTKVDTSTRSKRPGPSRESPVLSPSREFRKDSDPSVQLGTAASIYKQGSGLGRESSVLSPSREFRKDSDFPVCPGIAVSRSSPRAGLGRESSVLSSTRGFREEWIAQRNLVMQLQSTNRGLG